MYTSSVLDLQLLACVDGAHQWVEWNTDNNKNWTNKIDFYGQKSFHDPLYPITKGDLHSDFSLPRWDTVVNALRVLPWPGHLMQTWGRSTLRLRSSFIFYLYLFYKGDVCWIWNRQSGISYGYRAFTYPLWASVFSPIQQYLPEWWCYKE